MKQLQVLLILFILLYSCSVSKKAVVEEPKREKDEVYVKHLAYSAVINPGTFQANWVSYELTSEETMSVFDREKRFKEDTSVLIKTAADNDYKHSGYDRGHLAPAADMGWNDTAMKESFLFTNVAPQNPSFNRGMWKKLEEKTREWAVQYGSVYITTGPLFIDTLGYIGENKVPVSSHFFKTLLVYNDTLKTGIAFVFPNQKCEGNLLDYSLTIDSTEAISGYDFYPSLPNKQEKEIEGKVEVDVWR